MPCLEDIDDLITDKQQWSSADEDCKPRHTFGTNHQQQYSYNKSYIDGEEESGYQLEKKQVPCYDFLQIFKPNFCTFIIIYWWSVFSP